MNYFVIGDDGTGNLYILDISKDASPVFLVDHGATAYGDCIEMDEEAPSLTSWIPEMQKEEIRYNAEEELQERELAERKQNKKWWQFWI